MGGLPYRTGPTPPPDDALRWYAPPVPYQLAVALEGLAEVWGRPAGHPVAACSPAVNELLRLRLRQAGFLVRPAIAAPSTLPAPGEVVVVGDHEPLPVGAVTFPVYPSGNNELSPGFLLVASGSPWKAPPWGLVTRAEAAALLVKARQHRIKV